MAKKENGQEGPEQRIQRVASMIEFRSNRSVVVEGCRGILEYDDCVIRVSVGRMNLKFEGRNLEVVSMSTDAIAIEGFILALSFET